jgi:hypothetical protein
LRPQIVAAAASKRRRISIFARTFSAQSAGIDTVEGANEFLSTRYLATFNEKFSTAAAEKGTAFRKTGRTDLDWVCTVQTERVVAKDNTVTIAERNWQSSGRIPGHDCRQDRVSRHPAVHVGLHAG